MREAIFQLPAEQREVVPLHYMQGLSQKEIADRLDTHSVAVHRLLKRAMVNMKQLLEPVIRETAKTMVPQRKAGVWTTAFVVTIGAMSASAKSAMAQTAAAVAEQSLVSLSTAGSMSVFTKVLSLLKSIPVVGGIVPETTAGGILMTLKAKVIAVCILVPMLVTGVYYVEKKAGAVEDEVVKEATGSKVGDRSNPNKPFEIRSSTPEELGQSFVEAILRGNLEMAKQCQLSRQEMQELLEGRNVVDTHQKIAKGFSEALQRAMNQMKNEMPAVADGQMNQIFQKINAKSRATIEKGKKFGPFTFRRRTEAVDGVSIHLMVNGKPYWILQIDEMLKTNKGWRIFGDRLKLVSVQNLPAIPVRFQ